MADKEKFYITTPIYYPSGNPHIGHCYTTVACDSIARYKRLQGKDVMFLTGTDEHGLKIEQKAAEKGITPKAYVDEIVEIFKKLWSYMNISYDRYIRTTDDYHVETVQKIFKELYDRGYIYKGKYTGKYCTPCESFWTDSQLVDGKCPDCGREVKPANEEAYFLRLSKYQKWLEDYIEEHPNFIVPESRKKEMLNNFIKPGLQDLCVSRTTFKWSIPVTFDPKHVIYVWIDALSNYITAMGYDPDGSSEVFEKYWPCDCHVIGKDIMRFHSIYWPIMLHALGLEIPKQLFGHNWILFGEDKMSKSRGNVIYSDDVVKAFGVDGARYYLLSEMPVNSDGSITYESLVERYNSDLANTLGNLVNRSVAMAKKYFGGEIMPPIEHGTVDHELIHMAEELPKKIESLMNEYRMADTMDAIMSLARRANKYIDETSPWVLAKDEEQSARLGTVLYNLLETIRFIGVALEPFMPETSEKILDEIGAGKRDLASLERFGALEAGKYVGEPVPIFARIDADKFMEEANAEMAARAAAAKAEEEAPSEEIVLAPEILIDDFAKIEIRAAKILSAEKVKKSDKLLCLQLDDGMGGRQVVSGIAQYYTPEELVGKKVQLIANLKPVKLRGVDSFGMICAADTPDGVKVIFLDDSIPAGSKIR